MVGVNGICYDGTLQNGIKNMYFDSELSVRINEIECESFIISRGVR